MIEKLAKGWQYISMMALLNMGSIMCIFGALYVATVLSILYGMGIGAIIQTSSAANAVISSTLYPFASQLNFLHVGILESYALFVVSLVLVVSSLMVYLRGGSITNPATRRYVLLSLAITVIYLVLFLIVLSEFSDYFQSVYIYVPYAGITLSIVVGASMEVLIRHVGARQARLKRSISLDPTKPFSNLISLQEMLLPNMTGQVAVIDKHFNSVALSNFSRLVGGGPMRFNKVVILTSKEMLDAAFNGNVTDFRNELGSSGIDLDVRVLDDKDAMEQHERILMSDTIAYKVPPFNIINRKSEHITPIGLAESRKRFNYLYGRATKLENYLVKEART